MRTEEQARCEVKAALANKAKDYLEGFTKVYYSDDLLNLLDLGARHRVEIADDGAEVRYMDLDPDQMAKLLEMVKENRAAFEAASYVARLLLARRKQLPDELLDFVLAVLRGDIQPPKGRGRPTAPEKSLKSFMYAWALYIAQSGQDIPLSANTESKQDLNACQLVADAFTSAGRPTTAQQVKSYCYDASYGYLRALAAAAWHKERKYNDYGVNFEFDLDAFCLGKP